MISALRPAQQTLQIPQRMKHIGFDGTDRRPEHRRDFLMAHFLVDAEHECGALLSRQLRHREADALPAFSPHHPI